MKRSAPEAEFSMQCRAYKLNPVAEFKFHPVRKWRFDFCIPDAKLAIEIEGGIWISGRHQTGTGFTADCEKYNHAALLGYRLFRFTPAMVRSGEAIEMLLKALE